MPGTTLPVISAVTDDHWLVVMSRTSPTHLVLTRDDLLRSIGMTHGRDPQWSGARVSVDDDRIVVTSSAGERILEAQPLSDLVCYAGQLPALGHE